MYIVIFMIVLLMLLSMTYLSVNIIFHRIKEDDIINITLILLFGLIKFRFRIPYIDIIIGRNMKPGVKIKSKLLTKKISILNFEELKAIYDKITNLVKIYKDVLFYLLPRISIKHIKWHTEIGLEDAALTAIATGALWSIKGNVIGILTSKICSENIDVTIKPNYDRLIFEINMDCIIRIKIANIIIAGFKIAYKYLFHAIFKKGGESNERSSYRRTNENYNG